MEVDVLNKIDARDMPCPGSQDKKGFGRNY